MTVISRKCCTQWNMATRAANSRTRTKRSRQNATRPPNDRNSRHNSTNNSGVQNRRILRLHGGSGFGAPQLALTD